MPSPEWHGPLIFRLRAVASACWLSLYVSLRRLLRGPLLPNWNWTMEVGTHLARHTSRVAFDMSNILDGRAYQNSLVPPLPTATRVTISAVTAPVKGEWYSPESSASAVTLLYLHGGGYAYYPRSYQNLIAIITSTVQCKTFALDYRLIPEHPFPAQLEDALVAYRWLLETGINPRHLVVAGDSAGGNLTLALLLALRDASLPLPALGVCLCPWTDVTNSGDSMTRNEKYDIVEKRMAEQWAQWFCAGADPRDPRISPVYADLRGLPPIYIQAGSAEILYDMICAFAEKGKQQGADVEFQVWENMNHDFQAFGALVPASRAALNRIAQVIHDKIC